MNSVLLCFFYFHRWVEHSHMVIRVRESHTAFSGCGQWGHGCWKLISISGSEYIRTHPEFGETFSSWVLFESARGCYNAFEKKWQMLSGSTCVIQQLGESVDFLNPRICNSSVLQCILHAVNSVTAALYDGVSQDDMKVLLLEVTKLCVVWRYIYISNTFVW